MSLKHLTVIVSKDCMDAYRKCEEHVFGSHTAVPFAIASFGRLAMLGDTQGSMAQLGLKAVTGLWLDRVPQVMC